MRSRRRTIARRVTMLLVAAGVACGVTAALLLAGCGSASEPVPGGPPDQTGYILAVTPGSSATVGALLLGPISTMGEASVRVTLDTVWLRGSQTIPAPPLDNGLLGQQVAVKFTGPVAESFPVQATAAWIRLLPTGASSVDGRTLVVGGLISTPRAEPDERVAIHWGGEDGPIIETVVSDSGGRFHVDLRPGEYTLVTLPTDDKTPGARHLRVEPRTPALTELIESVR